MSGRRIALTVGVVLAVAGLLVLLVLPLIALVLRVPVMELWRRLGDPVVLGALWLSLLTSAASTLLTSPCSSTCCA